MKYIKTYERKYKDFKKYVPYVSAKYQTSKTLIFEEGGQNWIILEYSNAKKDIITKVVNDFDKFNYSISATGGNYSPVRFRFEIVGLTQDYFDLLDVEIEATKFNL